MNDLKNRLTRILYSGEIELISTHARLSFPIIERMYRKMVIDVPFTSIQIADRAIINGHHRYLASLLANYQLSRSIGIRSRAKTNVEWRAVVLDDTDWDTPEDIEKFNLVDARYSGMSLVELVEKVR